MRQIAPVEAVCRQGVGVVVGEEVEFDGLHFEVAVGVEVGVALGEEVRDVGKHAFEFAAVDVVEFAGVGPGGFEVVDFEAAVWWGPM